MEKDYTIFYGVYVLLNILLIGILLGTVNHEAAKPTIPEQKPLPSPEPLTPADPLPSTDPPATAEPPPQKTPAEKPKAPIIYSGPTNEKSVAITFDDGPSPRTLHRMLDILDNYNAKATFFLLGQNAKGEEDLVREIHQRGHQVASHSYSHPKFSTLTWDEAMREITKTEEVIGSYMSHKYFRVPYGDYDTETLELAHYLNYDIIYWSVDPRDWAATSSKEIVDVVKGDTKPGSIILFHEGKDLTVQALPEILEWLIEEGYSLVTVAELLK